MLRKSLMLAAVALTLTASNCPNSQAGIDAFQERGVVVSYALAQRCTFMASGPPNTSDVGSGPLRWYGPFLIYEVRAIANTGSRAASFRFDSGRLHTQAAGGARFFGAGSGRVTPVTVAPGSVWAEGGRVIMKLADAGPADTRLRYTSEPGEPPVVMQSGVQAPIERDTCPIGELLDLPSI